MQTLLTFTLLQPPELPSPHKRKQGSTELALLRSGGRGAGGQEERTRRNPDIKIPKLVLQFICHLLNSWPSGPRFQSTENHPRLEPGGVHLLAPSWCSVHVW